MTITTSRAPISAGEGYRYLTRGVAAGDGDLTAADALLRYYEANGTPPGRWLGTGQAGLGGTGLHAADQVAEEQMARLFGLGVDPVTGQPLSRVHTVTPTYRERVAARLADLPTGLSPAERAEQVERVRVEESARRPQTSRAGFDLTFQVPKSVSTLWAIGDAGVQAQIARAHHEAIAETLAIIEREVLMTRVGSAGVAQVETRGLIAAAFDHFDSRAGDPHLHTHVVVANRVQGADGKWRTIDSRALYRAVVAMSRTHEGLLLDRLAQRLPIHLQADSPERLRRGQLEVAGVPRALREEFSQRRQAILAERATRLAAFRDEHGREPSARESRRIDQLAWAATREQKSPAPLVELTRRWRARAADVLADTGLLGTTGSDGPRPEDAAAWVRDLLAGTNRQGGQAPVLRFDDFDAGHLGALGAMVRETGQEQRATWTRWNVHSEAAAALTSVRFAAADDRERAIGAVVEAALADSILVSAPALAHTPAQFLRSDGTSAFEARHGQIYTSAQVLAAEDHLLARLRDTAAPAVDAETMARELEQIAATRPLGPDQGLAVTQIATSGRALDVLVGPAGAGKTTTLAALRAGWEAEHGPGSVVGLAPSAAATAVLGAELEIATDNTAKWLAEHDQLPARLARLHELEDRAQRMREQHAPARTLRRVEEQLQLERGRVEKWSLRAGQLVIVDEASLAGTFALERISRAAQDAGAKVVLVGDPHQLSAVNAGGAFALLTHDLGAHASRLREVHRFTESWEAEASLRLRLGQDSALDDYAAHGRVIDGDADLMAEAAYTAWRADLDAGRSALLIASDNDTVRELNTRARTDLVAAGAVAEQGLALHDGTTAGTADVVVTRHNDRTLATSATAWVKNGDRWQVSEARPDGSLIVRREDGGATIALPAHYVAEHVELGYASTVHRAQGATVQAGHVLITGDATTRESLYVAMTRGRAANHVYVATEIPAEQHAPASARPTGREVLERALANTGAEQSAHQLIASEQDAAASIARLAHE